MKNSVFKGVALAVGIVLTALAGTAVALGSGDRPPPRPPWVNADGTVDVSRMPTRIGVVDAQGQVVRDASGNLVTIDPRPQLPAGPQPLAGLRDPGVLTVEHGIPTEVKPVLPVTGFVQGVQPTPVR